MSFSFVKWHCFWKSSLGLKIGAMPNQGREVAEVDFIWVLSRFCVSLVEMWIEAERFMVIKGELGWIYGWQDFSPFFFFYQSISSLLNRWQPWGTIGLFVSNPFKLCLPFMKTECCGSANLAIWNKEWHWVLLAFLLLLLHWTIFIELLK